MGPSASSVGGDVIKCLTWFFSTSALLPASHFEEGGFPGRKRCEAINTYWFETLERSVMQEPKAVSNHASRRILEHEGMRMIGTQEGDFVTLSSIRKIPTVILFPSPAERLHAIEFSKDACQWR